MAENLHPETKGNKSLGFKKLRVLHTEVSLSFLPRQGYSYLSASSDWLRCSRYFGGTSWNASSRCSFNVLCVLAAISFCVCPPWYLHLVLTVDHPSIVVPTVTELCGKSPREVSTNLEEYRMAIRVGDQRWLTPLLLDSFRRNGLT